MWMAENILIFPYLRIIMYEIVEYTTLLHAMKMANALNHTYKSNEHLLSHLLVAGCNIGVRFSVRPSVNIYVDVRHLCQS